MERSYGWKMKMLMATSWFAWVALAQTANPVADVNFTPGGIEFRPKVSGVQIEVKVNGPDDKMSRRTVPVDSWFVIDPSFMGLQTFMDGDYQFELQAIPLTPNTSERTGGNAGLEPGGEELPYQSGYFLVQGGLIVTQNPSSGSREPVDQDLPTDDQVILDDLIVDGSACVGFDCVNGENFGFDTIRLKENNLRIKFQDTSNSASFPTNDWSIEINSSSNGGGNYFAVLDIDGGRTPFLVEAGAPTSSLYVDSGGRVGFGTNNPVVELHVNDGDTPTLRLEQNGSSGFAPQTFDVAGNETNFFIRDVTNGSTLPIRLRPGAPTSAFDIDGQGDIGMGTSSPNSNARIHVRRTSDVDAIIMSETLKDSGGTGDGSNAFFAGGEAYVYFGSWTDDPIRFATNAEALYGDPIDPDNWSWKMQLNTNGTLDMQDGGSYNGTWNAASSRTKKEQIRSLSSEEASSALANLEPVRFRYIADKSDERLGFIAEDVPELVAMKDRKNLSALEIVALLTKVVQEQQAQLEQQQKTIETLGSKLEALENHR